ncbi:MAG TPA: MBL fold metallo-hydrolase [Thermoprotei archaeon]|nr:MBL fold metallo-hydrolase [Thermoprotei archaeon]
MKKIALILTSVLLIIFLYLVVFPSLTVRKAEKIKKVKCSYVEKLEILVLVDNNPNTSAKNIQTAWGLSILVKTENTTILFDTGPSPEVLKHNTGVLGTDLHEVDFIVISHEHGDHIGGLEYLARIKPGLKVYIPSKISLSAKRWIKSLNLTVIEVEDTLTVAKGVFIVGQVYGPPWEQALAVNTSRGLVVIVGCSHAGVDKIVDKARKSSSNKVYLVLGGFHTYAYSKKECRRLVERLIAMKVELIAPIHCSGDTIRKLLETEYSKHYLRACVGTKISIDE